MSIKNNQAATFSYSSIIWPNFIAVFTGYLFGVGLFEVRFTGADRRESAVPLGQSFGRPYVFDQSPVASGKILKVG